MAPHGRPWQVFEAALLASSQEVPQPDQWSSDPYTITNYDAVNIMALAMLVAGTPDPSVFNARIRGITESRPGAVIVHSFQEGVDALHSGHAVEYVGASGPVAFNQWQTSSGSFAVARYDPSGATSLVDSVTADAVALLE